MNFYRVDIRFSGCRNIVKYSEEFLNDVSKPVWTKKKKKNKKRRIRRRTTVWKFSKFIVVKI